MAPHEHLVLRRDPLERDDNTSYRLGESDFDSEFRIPGKYSGILNELGNPKTDPQDGNGPLLDC